MSLGGEEMATIRNQKIMNGKAHLGKQAYNKGRKSSTDKANGEVKRQKWENRLYSQ